MKKKEVCVNKDCDCYTEEVESKCKFSDDISDCECRKDIYREINDLLPCNYTVCKIPHEQTIRGCEHCKYTMHTEDNPT